MKPDESFSDDFLFPMTSTRLSYTSSPESDGEFCDPETPRTLSRNQSYDPNSQMQQNTQFNGIQQTQKVTRSNSNPSLHREDGTIKSDNGAIPDYNSPPPYAVNLPATVSYALYLFIIILRFHNISYSTYKPHNFKFVFSLGRKPSPNVWFIQYKETKFTTPQCG